MFSCRDRKFFGGISARYQTELRNFDKAFIEFEEQGFVEWGVQQWLDENPELPWVLMRASAGSGTMATNFHWSSATSPMRNTPFGPWPWRPRALLR